MGAYSPTQWPAPEIWKKAVRKRKKLILNPSYGKIMYDECFTAVAFGYTEPLMDKILLYSLPSEYEIVNDLFSGKVDITYFNGNLVISN